MKPRRLCSTALVLAAALAANAAPPPAAAQISVLESSTSSIKAGARLEDAERISMPAGSVIRVVLPSGKTRTLRGPFEGTVSELTKGEPRNEGVMAWLAEFLKTGGARDSTPGATRGFAPPAPKPAGFSWSAVPAMTGGTVCVQKAAALQLVRPDASRAETAAVIDAATSTRGEVRWEAGSAVASWPAELAPRPDGAYFVLVPGRAQRQVTLRVLDKLPAEEDVLAELHRQGCKQQFEAWVGAAAK